ncbi:ATP-binding protein [Sungkyunkwania multivorans]|uniref:histidine kinase n=1 Tax=Sungkyunkwania multivorans TaxID=1173618 RepID=A0ABW3CWE6_9FLAO
MPLFIYLKRILQYLLFFGVGFGIYAQDTQDASRARDSIMQLIYLTSDHIQTTDYTSALDYSTRAVQMAQKLEDRSIQAQAYNSLGNVYQAINENNNAEIYFAKALTIGEELNDIDILISATNGLSYVHYEYHKDPDKGIDFLKRSYAYCLEANQPIAILVSLLNLANMYLENNRPKEAAPYLEKVRKAYRFYADAIPKYGNYVPVYHMNMEYLHGLYHRQLNENQQAIAYFRKAQEIGEEHHLPIDLLEVYKNLHEIYKEQGNERLTIDNLEKLVAYKSIVYDIEKNNQLETIKSQFEIDQYRRELSASEKEKGMLAALSKSKSKTIMFTTISIAMLLVLLGSMFYSYKKRQSNYELKLLNEKLEIEKNNAERLTKLKSNFISRVSHEIRTPLYGVMGITSILEEDSALIAKHRQSIDALKFSGQHLIKLVETVLNIRQIEYQNIQLNITNNDLHAVIENIIHAFEFQAKERNNKLDVIIDKAVSKYYEFDRVRLSEILINLVENAIKFTKDGTVTVAVELAEALETEDKVTFKVRDTGEGILEDNLALVFDDFNQAKEEQNIYDGAGLGLPMVKHLLELMDSHIQLESVVGKGSTFWFTLTLPKGEAPVTDTNKKIKKRAALKKILVVEDNKMSQMVTSNLIKLIGYDCRIAENGLKAYEVVKAEAFDLVLMDLNMPVMNGFEATKRIKSYCSEISVIGLTATDVTKIREDCVKVGMIDVFNKPISKSQLDLLINKYTGAS